jgi:hypothetical protein
MTPQARWVLRSSNSNGRLQANTRKNIQAGQVKNYLFAVYTSMNVMHQISQIYAKEVKINSDMLVTVKAYKFLPRKWERHTW